MAQHPGRHNQGPRGSGGGQSNDRSIPKPKEINYFKDGRPDPALMDEVADDVAQRFQRENLKPTQLRRHYDNVITLRQRLNAQAAQPGDEREQAFDTLRADFKMLKAKAAYAYGRDDRTFPKSLLQFFVDHVHSVKTARDFDVFFQHFQAVVAFHKFYKPKD